MNLQPDISPIRSAPHRAQRGMVLITSLLLLVVVTLLAVAMFRSMGVDARIAGNVREKQRALHAAIAAEQYAENWLASATSAQLGATACAGPVVNVNQGSNQVLVCSNQPYGANALELNPALTPTTATTFVPTQVPWTLNSGAAVGFAYTPPNMNVGTAPAGQSAANWYVAAPMFYISYLGASASNSQGAVYQIDAMGYGGTADAVAVVESTYQIASSTNCLGGVGC